MPKLHRLTYWTIVMSMILAACGGKVEGNSVTCVEAGNGTTPPEISVDSSFLHVIQIGNSAVLHKPDSTNKSLLIRPGETIKYKKEILTAKYGQDGQTIIVCAEREP